MNRLLIVLVLSLFCLPVVQTQENRTPVVIDIEPDDINAQMIQRRLSLLLKLSGYYLVDKPSSTNVIILEFRVIDAKSPDYYLSIILPDDQNPLTDVSPLLSFSMNLTDHYVAYVNDTSFLSLSSIVRLVKATEAIAQGQCESLLEIESITIGQVYSYFLAGTCALINQNKELAEDLLTQSLMYTSDVHGGIVTNLAWVSVQQGDSPAAIALMDALVDAVSSNPLQYRDALIKRAGIHALTFDYTSALQDMDEAIQYFELDKHLAQVYKQRADIVMLIYEWNRALADYNQAITLDPDYAEAYYRRGILYYTMVERENAIDDFQMYLALASDGKFVESARQYIADIQIELDALGG